MGHATESNEEDVVGFLKAQHKQIEALLKEVVATVGADRVEKFRDLCHLLTIHEAGEEAVVHPVASRALKHGEAMVAARLKEEMAAMTTIAELKLLDPSSDAFDVKLRKLQSSVVAHAGREERDELNKLIKNIDRDRLLRMRKAVEMVESRTDGDAPDDTKATDPGVYERVTLVNPRDWAAGGP